MALGLLGVEVGKGGTRAHWCAVVMLENVVSIRELVLPHEAGDVHAQVESATAHFQSLPFDS